MSGVKWTKEQMDAITERGCNLLVAAAAGSGKTAVLVERIIRRITDEKRPVDIDRLLVVTFTNAAATEMRERISDAISKILEKNPGSKHLQRQLTLLNRAAITTIHSFCLEVIRNNFHLIDLDPGFRIADQTESLLMKIEALEELFEEKYDEGNVSGLFLQLVECYGGKRDDQALQNMVLEIFEFVQSCPWPERWLTEKTEAFNVDEGFDFANTIWGRCIIENVRIELSGILDMMRRTLDTISSSRGLEPYIPAFDEDIANIEVVLKNGSGSWDEFYDSMGTFQFRKLSRCKKDTDKAVQEMAKAVRNEFKGRIKKIKEEVFVSKSGSIISDLKRLHPLVVCLSQLVLELGEKYRKKKNEKSVLDFNDLEHYCLDILFEDSQGLIPSKVALELREKFEEILVDEYQDSNMVQEVILSTISRQDSKEPNMFMVGDVKQSIYRFRQAKPELFLQKYNTYSEKKGSRNRVIQLFKNFRSRKEIIDCSNFIFKQIMSRNIGELDYDEKEELNFGAEYLMHEGEECAEGKEVELHIIDMKQEDSDNHFNREDNDGIEEQDEGFNSNDNAEELDNIQVEARIIAKRIRELTGDSGKTALKVLDNASGILRNVEYRDIAVLLRTTSGWADIFVKELSQQGIPVYGDTGTGYFNTVEVQTIMSLLQIVDNPMQDIPFLSVLRSPIGGFTPDELIDIRISDKESTIYEAMKELSGNGNSKTAEKAKGFLKRLGVWRDKARFMSTDELIWYLYTDTGYYGYTGAMPGGAQRQANLRVLFERARLFEQTSYRGLFNFINFINRLRSSKGDMGSAKILGEKENVVRIISIHKSKGLEFPVVFVSGCGKKFNMQDMSKSILIHQDFGLGPDFVDVGKRISYPTAPKKALKYKIKRETLSEEMRILYVALTRAKEKLIITGYVKDFERSAIRWCGSINTSLTKLPDYEVMKASCYLDWLGPCVARHRDFAALRETGGLDSEQAILQDESRWKLYIWRKSDAGAELTVHKDDEKTIGDIGDIELKAGDREINKEIERRLGWEYKYKMSSKIPVKISVTELKRFFNAEFSGEYQAEMAYMQPLVTKPRFLQEQKGLTPAEKGSLLHFVMQHLELGLDISESSIEKQLAGMVSRKLIDQYQAENVSIYKIKEFFNSALGRRMLKADKIFREVPFNIELECSEIYDNLSGNICPEDTILLQGIIDCYFEEGDGLVLVDYKTDYVAPGGIDAVKKRYRVQIDYYAKALERITGKRVTGKYIYLFWNGQTVEY
jgi:ATP-dependent helicase/nuclease subunit A